MGYLAVDSNDNYLLITEGLVAYLIHAGYVTVRAQRHSRLRLRQKVWQITSRLLVQALACSMRDEPARR